MNNLEQAVLRQSGLGLKQFRKCKKFPGFRSQKSIETFYKEHRVGILVYLKQSTYSEGCSLGEYLYRQRSDSEITLTDIEDVLLGIPNPWQAWITVDIVLAVVGLVSSYI